MNINPSVKSLTAAALSVLFLIPVLSLSAPSRGKPASGLADGIEGGDDTLSQQFLGNSAAESGYDLTGAPSLGTPDPNSYRSPAGTVLYRTVGATCKTLTTTTWVDIFDQDIEFMTGPASSLVEVNYSSQVSIGSGPTDNRVYFKCSVSQDGGTTWTGCTGSTGSNGLILARRTTDTGNVFGASTHSGSYLGFLSGLLPSTATKVRLQTKVQLDNDGNSGQLCASNVIIRY